MANHSKACDVFISHSANDAALAVELAAACRANGLETLTDKDLASSGESSDALWDALAESRALLAVLSPWAPTPSMGVELGAARAWNKPIVAIATDPTVTRLPAALSETPLYPP